MLYVQYQEHASQTGRGSYWPNWFEAIVDTKHPVLGTIYAGDAVKISGTVQEVRVGRGIAVEAEDIRRITGYVLPDVEGSTKGKSWEQS